MLKEMNKSKSMKAYEIWWILKAYRRMKQKERWESMKTKTKEESNEKS